ncbi:Replication protein O [Robbsia sp. Bb-Pol-6]|uniref:Replication protein O n=1 Tax=Robbsia betulipollinis TaxID=2981849 RepID=A0ABT3ZTJ9_9BURK|nr:Replication protein O [Robbsia betulipollinis]MCY0389896.1 Replication protein O [Robbsia betulipollinis]
MSIAQRFVASEGEVCPADNTTSLTCFSSAKTPELATDVANFKWLTLRAEHRAHHIAGISSRARAVLAALARTVDNARPADKIFAGRGLLQERAMIPERTFFRALTDLAGAGLIVRHKQWEVPGRAGWNRAYLTLTDVAIALLGFNDRAQHHATESRQAAAVNDSDSKILSSESAKVAGPIKRDLYPASQKRQPGELPKDLQRLRDLGFHEFLIFKLMREAREKGKRLSDVINASWQHVKTAARPICYVRALLRSATDFASLARCQQTKQSEAQTIQSEADELRQVMNAAAGQTYYDAAATRRIRVSSDAQTAEVQSLLEPILRVASGDWQRGFAQALRTRQWVHATQALNAAFRESLIGLNAVSEPARPMTVSTSRTAIAALRSMMRGPRIESLSAIAA